MVVSKGSKVTTTGALISQDKVKGMKTSPNFKIKRKWY